MDFCDPLLFKVSKVQLGKSEIIFQLTDESEVKLMNIQKEVNQDRYNEFLEGYSQNIAAHEFIKMRIGENRLAVIRENKNLESSK